MWLGLVTTLPVLNKDNGENKSSLHNSVILAIFVPKIIKVGEKLTKLWETKFWLFILKHGVNTHLRHHTNSSCASGSSSLLKTPAYLIFFAGTSNISSYSLRRAFKAQLTKKLFASVW